MKAAAHNTTTDLIAISSCQWQLLKTHLHRNKNDSDSQQGKGQRLPRSRQRHSACRVGEFVYVFCGKDGSFPLKDVWKFHINHQTWEMVELRGGSLPILQGHTAVAYKRLIIIFGGTFNNSVNDAQLWTFNTDLGHLREVWVEPGAAQPLCRRDHSAVIYSNLMYVFGGFKDTTGASQELWAFNLDEEEWTDLTHLSHCRPSGRYGHTAVVADSAMWLFGGMAGLSPCTDFWKYSFLLHQWTKLKCVGSPPSLSGHIACAIHHQMIVVGGSCKGKAVSDVWSFRFDTNTWQKLNSTGMHLPALSFHTCVSVCPSDAKGQQSTDRAWSTPHLKPSSSLLHPDCFVVRPRTSPSVLDDTSPHDFHDKSCEHSGSEGSQVMSLEELKSATSELENNSSSHRSDPRIDVSLKEPLVSDSPGTVRFYDSCIPFSPRQRGDTTQDLQVLQHNTSFSSNSDTDSVRSGQTACQRSSHKAVTVELIDLSDSPVLKTSKRNKSAARRQTTFWNDLFIEDLEAADDGGLDELQISYPSKHPVLPPSCPVASDSDGLMVVENMSTLRHKNEENNRQQQRNKSLPSQEYENKCHSQNNYEVKEMKSLMDIHSTNLSKSVPSVSSPTVEHIQLERLQPQPQTNCLSHSNRSSLPPEQNQYLSVNKTMPTVLPRQRQWEQHRRSTGCDLDSEAETSFTQSGSSTQSERRARCNSVVASGGMFSGKTVTSADCLGAPNTDLWLRGTGRSDADADACSHEMRKGSEDCAREEAVIGEPFLLVLGGRTEEQVCIQPKPIALWKGSFV